MLSHFKNTTKLVILIFKWLIIPIFFFILIIKGFTYFIFNYGNQYITISNYEKNESFFEEIKNDIVNYKYTLGKRIGTGCRNGITGICTYGYELTDKSIENKLNIYYIEASSNTKRNEVFEITFYLNKEKYLQILEPRLTYFSTKIKKNGWYIPYPISNNLFYIGSNSLVIGEHWLSHGYFESAFN